MELINWKQKLEWLYHFIEKRKYVLIILLVGVFMLMLGGKESKLPEQTSQPTEETFSLIRFEEKMTQCLSRIDGIGKVELMLSLDSSGREIYASDIRKSASASYESTVSTISNGSYGEEAVKVTTTSPEFRGAVVVCEGAGNDRVRLAVTEAVGSLCGLGADRIAVIQMAR